MIFPDDPRLILRIERPELSGGESLVTYDTTVTTQLIKNASIELATNQSSEGRITFFDPKFRVIDAFSSATAKAVGTFYLGYGDDLGEPVFKGVLAQIERGETDSTFIFYDMAYVMKLIKKAGYKNKTDDVAIINGLVGRNNSVLGKPLQFEGPDEDLKLEKHNTATQDFQSDWDWMMERARDAGLVIYVRQDTVFAKKPAKTGRPVMTIRNRVDFELQRDWDFVYRTPESLDGKPKVVKHRRRGRDGKFLKGTSTESGNGREEVTGKRDIAQPTQKKLSKRAQAQKDLDKEYAFEGRLTMAMPSNGVRLDYRNTVEVKGVGKLFSAKYVCRTVRYDFAPGRLNVGLEMYRDIDS